jgi:transposase
MSKTGWPPCATKRERGEAFPPQQISEVREALRRAPPAAAREPAPARWSLWHLKEVSQLLSDYSVSGIWRLLQEWGLRYKRGRDYVHSPDPHYLEKRDFAQQCVERARASYPRIVTLYLDEVTYYRQPSLSSDWSLCGACEQPLARFSYAKNTKARVVAALDVVSGQVIFEQGAKIGVKQLARFYPRVREHYPAAEVIYVIQDNWPIHFYPQVMESAVTSRVEVVPLPTYAPWLNPIEKLWRKLKQEVLHLHRLSDEWHTLQQRVGQFLEAFKAGSLSLLRYVGLLPD